MSAVFIGTVSLFGLRPNKEQKRGKQENVAPVYHAHPRVSTNVAREQMGIEAQSLGPGGPIRLGFPP